MNPSENASKFIPGAVLVYIQCLVQTLQVWQNKWLYVVMDVFPERYEWLLEQIQIWGAKIYQTNATEHDHNMTYIQALRHFSTFAKWFTPFQTAH